MTESTALQNLAALMAAHGWSSQTHTDGDRIRAEGVHKSGAVAMCTARLKAGRWELSYYAIEANSAQWLRIRRAGLNHFLEHGVLDPSAPAGAVSDSKCTCRKVHAPTEAQALRFLDRARRKHLFRGAGKVEERVYRCPADARRWHMTSQTERSADSAWAAATCPQWQGPAAGAGRYPATERVAPPLPTLQHHIV
ncbi:hypothetical protein ABZ605_28045 [Streptomyces sp. NPDC012765]|uniref:hypothetical protein n=1 Tax=Streptomyces sp. NPDC012765 TaxID=3155249 RepID=UPI0033E96424